MLLAFLFGGRFLSGFGFVVYGEKGTFAEFCLECFRDFGCGIFGGI